MSWILLFMMMLSLLSVTSIDAAEQHKMPFPVGVDISERFVGTVHRNDLIEADDVYQVPQTNVITFEPGSHSGWHAHGAMSIIGVSGQGIYQEWGKEAVLINPGDVVQIPAGVSHFHGAVKDAAFQQIVIYDKNWKAPKDVAAVHTGPVTESEYNSLRFSDTDKTKAAEKTDEAFLFPYSPEPYASPNFNHPVYLGKILTEPNAANSLEWNYVVFPKGTYTRWHSHKEGQILIATDGVGYHKIQGGKVEVLHPGDVVYCPSGVVHWHGAAPNSAFAHIAINPHDNYDVNWYDFPTAEYAALQAPSSATAE